MKFFYRGLMIVFCLMTLSVIVGINTSVTLSSTLFEASSVTDNLSKTLVSQDEIYTVPDVLHSDYNQDSLDSFDPLFPRSSASYFRANSQKNPDYILKIEFYSAGLLPAVSDTLSKHLRLIPWFAQACQKHSNRLSAWKDGNSLYSGKITYHS